MSANYWPHGLLSSLTLANTTLPTIYYGGSSGTGLDGEGRVTTVTASSGTPTLANNVIYTTSGTTLPIGSLTSVTLGSGDSDTFGYDPLTGRLTGYTFNMNSAIAKTGGLTWNANGSLGTLTLIDNVTPGNSQTCSYSHDDLARIASASCVHNSTTVWSQAFAFDPFGNIDKTATAGTTFLPTYNLATNQYSTIPGCTPTYDGDGNLTNDCMHSYNWLADGAVASVDTVSLTYDALGRGVEQARGSSYTEIVYTPGGGKLALMNGTTVQKAFIPLPGGGTAVYTTGSSVAYYRHADWLGSSRLASTPTAPTTVYADTEYAPYGESYDITGSLDLNFTGQNQDTVASSTAGLYDFLFREYNPQHGRWISPDPARTRAVSLASPQTWNRYAYLANSPLNEIDPSGLGPLGIYGDCISCNPWMHSPGDKGFSMLVDSTTTLAPDGTWIGFGISPSGAIEIDNPSEFAETGEMEEYDYQTTYTFVYGTSSGGSTVSVGKPQPAPCHITDPVLGALELTAKVGPEVQIGPAKAGFSFYNNVTTGVTGGKAELNSGFFSVQADNPTPDGGTFGGGGRVEYSGSFLGFQYNFTTGSFGFNPSKSFTLGLQALVGGEVSFNSDTYLKLGAANKACHAQGGG
ncbi:MAG: RHS repeat-associated core domain-containing protein [Terriglobales bacterium]